jgi:hypothetical protein
MADDLLSQYIDRQRVIKDDTVFMVEEFDKIYKEFQKINSLKVNFDLSSSFGKAAGVVNEMKKSDDALAASIQNVNKEFVAGAGYQNADAAIQQINSGLDEGARALAELKLRAAENAKAQKDLVKAYQDGKVSFRNYTTQAGALIQREQDLKVQIADLTSQQKQFAKENNAVAGSMDQAGIRLGRLREEYRSLTDEEKASPFGKNLKAAIDALDPAIKQADASIGNFQRSVGNYAGQLAPGFKLVEDELTKVREQLKTMPSVGSPTVVQGFAQLQQQENALNNTTALLSTNFTTAKARVEGFRQASVQLTETFGAESAIVKSFNAEVSKSGIQIEGFAQKTEKAATKSTGLAGSVSKVFGGLRQIAYIIPGIGLAGLFDLAFQYASSFVSKLIEGNEKMETLKQNFENIKEVVANANKDAGKQIADLKILYQAATDVALADTARKDAAIELQKTYPETFKNFSIEEIELGKAKTGYDELTKAIIATARAKAAKDKIDELEAQRLDVAFQKQKIQNATDNEKARAADKTETFTGSSLGVGTSSNLVTKADQVATIEARRLKAIRDQDLKDQSLSEQEAFLIKFVGEANITKVVEVNLDKRGEASKKERDYEFELQKLLLEDEIKSQEEFSKNSLVALPQRNEAAKKANDARIALINLTAKHEKEQEGVTADQIKLIDAQKYIALRDNALKYSIDLQAILADRLKIQKEFSAEEQKIIDEANAYFAAQVKKQKEIQESEKPDFAGLAKDEVDMVKEGQDQILTVLETSSLEKETALREEYNKGLISEKQYQDKLAKIKKDAAKEAILFQIQAGEAQLKYLEAAGQAGTKAYDDIKHAVEGLKNAYANLGDTAAEKLKKLGDSLSLVNEYTQKLGSLLVQAAEIGYNKQRNALQALEDAQQKHYEKEVDRINQTVISETDKANQLKILEAQRLAQKEANDRKERQLETQKARYAKAANIANIITSGALAVVKALGEGGPILAAVVGALSAAELAIAIATPVPQYRHGTKDHIGGLAIVGDGGKKEYGVLLQVRFLKRLTNQRSWIFLSIQLFILMQMSLEKLRLVDCIRDILLMMLNSSIIMSTWKRRWSKIQKRSGH